MNQTKNIKTSKQSKYPVTTERQCDSCSIKFGISHIWYAERGLKIPKHCNQCRKIRRDDNST